MVTTTKAKTGEKWAIVPKFKTKYKIENIVGAERRSRTGKALRARNLNPPCIPIPPAPQPAYL